MFFELVVLSTLVLFSCAWIISAGFYTSKRWFSGVFIFLWFLVVSPLLFVLISFLVRSDYISLSNLSLGLYSSTLWSFWQTSTLIASVIPVFTFLVLTLTKPNSRAFSSLFALVFLVVIGLLFTLTNNLGIMLISFELLLLVSLYLLRLTAKSDRVLIAAVEMFFWTLFGSLALLIAFILLFLQGSIVSVGGFIAQPLQPLIISLLCLGFGVKLPIWPCYSWLLKAHVEASVEFSILLSGIVVKFGALGLQRSLGWQESGVGGLFLASCSTLAMLEVGFRVLAQRDLKRIVALTTVLEVNWIGVCLGLGGDQFEMVGAFILVAHSLTTAAEFFIVECIYKRYQTRDIISLSGLASALPNLYWWSFIIVLITIGFPGTSLFTGKLFFLTLMAQISGFLLFIFTALLVLIVPLAFIRIWVPIWYGQTVWYGLVVDLTGREISLLAICCIGGVLLGINPSLIF